MFRFIIAVSALMSGCAFTTGISSGVLPYKDATFTVTAENLQPSKAKKLAYSEGIEYCNKSSKVFKYIESRGEGQQTFVLYFECN